MGKLCKWRKSGQTLNKVFGGWSILWVSCCRIKRSWEFQDRISVSTCRRGFNRWNIQLNFDHLHVQLVCKHSLGKLLIHIFQLLRQFYCILRVLVSVLIKCHFKFLAHLSDLYLQIVQIMFGKYGKSSLYFMPHPPSTHTDCG